MKKLNITILADDKALKADDLFTVLEIGDSSFKTIISKVDNEYRCFMDEVSEDNDFGRIENAPENLSEIIQSKYTANVTGFDDDTETFSATVSYVEEKKVKTVSGSKIPEKLAKEIQSKMKEGVAKENFPALEARVSYMIKNHVHELDILDVIHYWSIDCLNEWGLRIPTYYVDPLLDTSVKQGKSGIISKAIQAYLVGSPKILKGPKSTGKNTLINSIIWLFGDRMEEHTFSVQDSMADVISSEGTDNSALERMKTISTSVLADAEKVRLAHAVDQSKAYSKKEDEILLAEALFKQLSAEAGSVHIIHEYRGFARWLLDSTGHTCYVADEINMADANLLVSLLHPILDGSITEYDLPGRGKVPLAKHLMMFGTENCGYAGEQEGNYATKSRFGAFELGQPNSIKDILHSAVQSGLKKIGITTDLEEKYYKQAEAFYYACKTATEHGVSESYSTSGELSDQCLNIRGIVRAMVQTKRFEGRTTLNQKLEDEVVTPCDDTERVMLTVLLNKIVTC